MTRTDTKWFHDWVHGDGLPQRTRQPYLDLFRSRHTLQNALALSSYASVCTFNCNSTTPVPRASRASTSAVPMARNQRARPFASASDCMSHGRRRQARAS